MNWVEYYEDSRKLRRSALKNTVLGLIGLTLGVVVPIVLAPPPFSAAAYMAAGFRGATVAAGVMLLFMGISLTVKSSGKPPHLISADTNGVALTVINERLFIPWRLIRDIRALRKDNQRCVIFDMHDSDLFIKVSAKNKKLLKKNLKVYGSAAVVLTNFCIVTNEQIARELKRRLERTAVDSL